MTGRRLDDWKNVDVIDTTAYDDAYFEGLATEIDAAVDVRPLEAANDRRSWVRWAVAAAAALALGWGLLGPDSPEVAPVAEAPKSEVDVLAADVAADLLPDALDDLAEDDDLGAHSLLVAALESDFGLSRDEGDDTLASGGSWMADLDDLTAAELAALAAKL